MQWAYSDFSTEIVLTQNAIPYFYQSFNSRKVFNIFNLWW